MRSTIFAKSLEDDVELKKIKPEETKVISVDILEKMQDFFEKNNLRYFIDFGSLIGVIRHKGFIPWDDDIDIAMPREDFEKMYDILEKKDFKLADNLVLGGPRNKYFAYKTIFEIFDLTTITNSIARKPQYRVALSIDIFVYDRVPDDKKVIRKWYKICRRTDSWSRCCVFKKHKTHHILKKIAGFFIQPFSQLWINTVDKKLRKLTEQNPHGKYFCFTDGMDYIPSGKDYADLVYDESIFNDYLMKPFEGKKFRVPKDYDRRLSDCYGDYMKLPPKSKQIPHFVSAYRIIKKK